MRLATWTHPTTRETRVYVNNAIGQSGAKICIKKRPGLEKDDWHVEVFGEWVNRRVLRDEVSAEVEKMVGHGCTFAQIVNFANEGATK